MKDAEVTQGDLDKVCLTISDEDEVAEESNSDLEAAVPQTIYNLM